MPHMERCTPNSYVIPLLIISEFGWEVNEGQVNIRQMTMPAAPQRQFSIAVALPARVERPVLIT